MPENSSNIETSRSLPPQQLPDKSHAPLVDPLSESGPESNGLSLAEKAMGFKFRDKFKDRDKQPLAPDPLMTIKANPAQEKASVQKASDFSDAEVSRMVEKLEKEDAARSGSTSEEAAVRDRLLQGGVDLKESPSFRAYYGVEARRAQQNLPDFNQRYAQREAILSSTGASDLQDLINRNPNAPEVAQLQIIENEMGQVFQAAVGLSGFAIDRNRDLTPQYLTELTEVVAGLRGGVLNNTQADALANYIENAALRTAGQESDGFSWEYQVPDAPERLQQVVFGEPLQGSTFQQTLEALQRVGSVDVSKPPRGVDQLVWQQTVEATRLQMLQERDQLIDQAEQAGVLSYVTDSMMSSFNLVQTQRFKAQQRVEEPTPEMLAYRIASDSKELFWDWGDPALSGLRDQFEGVGDYLGRAVTASVVKELHDPERPLNPADRGDRLLQELKDKRYRMRRMARAKDRLNFNEYMQRYSFNWAENKDELKDIVFDYIEKFEEVLASKSVIEAGKAIETWKHGGESSFDERVNSLGLSEAKDHEIKMLKAALEAFSEVIGGVKMLEAGKDGFDGYVNFLEQFSYEFNEHHDAMYLMNRKAAIAHAVLAEKDGAIFRSGPEEMDKPLQGDTKEYRARLDRKARKFAADHEIYIKERDFKEREHDGYSFHDNIEEMLLEDSRGMAMAQGIADPDKKAEAIVRVNARTAVFKRIKARLDKEDGFAGLNEAQRRDEIRVRIKDEMDDRGDEARRIEIEALPTPQEQDDALWEWVHRLNHDAHERRMDTWFPSKWDMVRLSIDKPQKLLDRALRKKSIAVDDGRGGMVQTNELRAMLEEVEEIHEFNFSNGVAGNINYKGLNDHQIDQQVDNLVGLTDVQRKHLKEDIKFERSERIIEADRAVRNGMAYAKFLGVEARWGGLVARKVDEDGLVKMKTISGMARDILSAKIKAEEDEIEAKTTAAIDAMIANPNNAGLTPEQIEEKRIEQRRLFRRHTTFAATHALKEIGLVEGNLPVWNYAYYGDEAMIKAFAPLVGYTDSEKPQLHQILDKGRREIRAVYDFLAEQYMEGKVFQVRKEDQLVVEMTDKDGNVIEDNNGIIVLGPLNEQKTDRARNINKGGSLTLRRLFESRFMISTSGGVEVADMISKVGDLGIYDLLWEHASEDLQEFHGFIKRRDESELAHQTFWNTDEWKDPVSYAKRLKAAPEGSAALTGGKVGGKSVPGILNEPMSGAYKVRDEVIKSDSWLDGANEFHNEVHFRAPDWKAHLMHRLDDLDSIGKLTIAEKDRLTEIGFGVIGPAVTLMDARNYVMNRAGRAPKNWKLDNELIFQEYVKQLLKRSPLVAEAGEIIGEKVVGWKGDKTEPVHAKGGEKIQDWGSEILGDAGLQYALEGRSLIAIAFYDSILRGSSYHLLSEKEKKAFTKRGQKAERKFKAKKAEIQARPLPQEVQDMITNRSQDLASRGGDSSTVQGEAKRLQEQYREEQLHKEFPGEWEVSFAHIGDIKHFGELAHIGGGHH